jgi:hypothetical protein
VNAAGSASGATQIDLTRINHLASTGTPLAHLQTQPNEACESCHMPKSSPTGSRMHLWRINTAGTYATMGATRANTAPDGAYAEAAWVDVDLACGQCHGGSGSAQPGMPYFTTSQLAIAAVGMHGSSTGTNAPPLAAETCSLDANTWTMTVTDASSDDHDAISQQTLTWGDGSPVIQDRTAPFGPFVHTYIGAGTYQITHRTIDDVGQMATHTCLAEPVPFTISGTVTNIYASHNATLAGATVTVARVADGLTAGTAQSDANGAYSVGGLKPGAYVVSAVKVGYVFQPAVNITVGPSGVVDLNSPTVNAVKQPKSKMKPSIGSGVSIPGVH